MGSSSSSRKKQTSRRHIVIRLPEVTVPHPPRTTPSVTKPATSSTDIPIKKHLPEYKPLEVRSESNSTHSNVDNPEQHKTEIATIEKEDILFNSRDRGENLLLKCYCRTKRMYSNYLISIGSNSTLSTVRMHIKDHFKEYLNEGFVFLWKTKEISKNDEKNITVFDILPKLTDRKFSSSYPKANFRFRDVDYKAAIYKYDGGQYPVTCAHVVCLSECSSNSPPTTKSSHPKENTMDGFAFIPSNIISWQRQQLDVSTISLHIHAALGDKVNLLNAIKCFDGKTRICDILDERNATPLHYAAENIPQNKDENGNLDICKMLVNCIGIDQINQRDINGKTPLHCALYRKRKNVIPYLLELKSDIRIKDIYGNHCLKLLQLQSESDLEYFATRLQTCSIDIEVTILMCYVILQKKNEKLGLDICKCLTNYKGFKSDVLNFGCSLLHLSARFSYQISEILIIRGFSKLEKDLVGWLPIHWACSVGNIDQVNLLYDVQLEDRDIWLGIQISLKNGYFEQCKTMAELRTTLSLDETTTCMLIEHLDKTFKLLRQKKLGVRKVETIAANILPILIKENGSSEKFLFDCAFYGLDSILILMKTLGSDFNQVDLMGRCPLHEASQQNNIKCVAVLLNGGANPNCVDWRHASPVHYAAEKGNTAVVELLAEEKAHLGLQENSGRTPLLSSIFRGKSEVTRFLLENHVDRCNLQAVDKLQQTILHYLPFIDENLQEIVLKNYKNSQAEAILDNNLAKGNALTTVWSGTVTETNYRSKFSMSQAMGNEKRKSLQKRRGPPFQNLNEPILWKTRKQLNESHVNPKESPIKHLKKCGNCLQIFTSKDMHVCKRNTLLTGEHKTVSIKAFEFHKHIYFDSNNPFLNAIRCANFTTAKLLLQHDPTLLQSKDELGRSHLEFAIQQESEKILKAVVDITEQVSNKTIIHQLLMQEKQAGENVTTKMLNVMISSGYAHFQFTETAQISHHCYKKLGEIWSNSCNFKRCHFKTYLPIEASIVTKNRRIFHTVLEKTNPRNMGAALPLAVYFGNAQFLEALCKKKRKAKANDKKMQTIENLLLIDVACRSPYINEMIIATLIKYHPSILESREISTADDLSVIRPYLDKDINLNDPKMKTPLAKLLSPSHMQMKQCMASRTVIDRIGSQLVNMGIFLGKYYEKSKNGEHFCEVHGVCEALLVALMSNHFSTAVHILQTTGEIVWECSFSKSRCEFQNNLDKWLCETRPLELPSLIRERDKNQYIRKQRENQEQSLGLIKYLLLMACCKTVPSDVLKYFLEAGRKFNENNHTSCEIKLAEIKDNEIRKEILIKEDPVEKVLMCILHLMGTYSLTHKFYLEIFSSKSIGKTGFLRILQFAPVVFPFVRHYSVRLFDCDQSDSREEIKLLRASARLICWEHKWLPDGINLLHLACVTNNLDFVKMVLEAPFPVEVVAKSKHGLRPLDVTALYGYWEIAEYLLQRGAEHSIETVVFCCSKETVLTNSGIDGWGFDRLRQLVFKTEIPDQKAKILENLLNTNELDFAICEENHGILEKALTNQLDEIILLSIERNPTLICSTLNKSIYNRYLQKDLQKCKESTITKVYNHLSHQLEHLGTGTKGLLLVYALLAQRYDVVDKFMKALEKNLPHHEWINTLKQTDLHGRTAFHITAINANEDIVLQLVKKISIDQDDCPLNAIDNSGASALWYAVAFKKWKIAEIFLWSGASPIFQKAVPHMFPKRMFELHKTEEMENNNVRLHSPNNDSAEVEACLNHFTRFNKSLLPNTTHQGSKNAFLSEEKKFPKVNTWVSLFNKINRNTKRNLNIHVFKFTRTKDEKRIKLLIRKSYTSRMLGLSLIHFASRTGDAELLRNILSISSGRLLQCNEFTEKVMMYAILSGNKKILDIIYKNSFLDFPKKPFLLALISLITTRVEFIPMWSVHRSLMRLMQFIQESSKKSIKEPSCDNQIASINKHQSPKQNGRDAESFRLYVTSMKNVLKESSMNESTIDDVVNIFIFAYEMVYNLESKRRRIFGSLEQLKNNKTLEYIQVNIKSILKNTSEKDNIDEKDIFLLAMLNQSWCISCITEAAKTNKYIMDILKRTILLDLTILDLIIIIMPENHGRNEISIVQQVAFLPEIEYLTGHMKLYLKDSAINIAIKKNLWIILKQVATNILPNEKHKHCWKLALARSLKDGTKEFFKTFIDQVSVEKLPEAEKARYVAYLCIAAIHGKTEVVQYLLNRNVPVRIDTTYSVFEEFVSFGYNVNWDVLQHAIKGNKLDTVETVIKYCRENNVYRKSANFDEMLNLASNTGNWTIMKCIRDFFVKRTSKMNWENYLLDASARGLEGFCLNLLEQEKNIDILCLNSSYKNVLHFCSIFGMIKLAKEILKTSPNTLKQIDSEGMKPVDYATLFGNVELVNMFYEKDGETSKIDKFETYGWFRQHLQGVPVKKDLNKTIDIRHAIPQKRGLSISNLLMRRDDFTALNVIRYSKHIKQYMPENKTLGHVIIEAIKYGCTDTFFQLVSYFQDNFHSFLRYGTFSIEVWRKTTNNQSINQTIEPLGMAIMYSRRSIVEFLLQHTDGINWRHPDTGENILHLAVKTGNPLMIKLVNTATNGKLLHEKDSFENTPVVYLVALGHQNLFSVLNIEDQSTVEAFHDDHEYGEPDFSCVHCILNKYIGWSKFYLEKCDIQRFKPIRSIHLHTLNGHLLKEFFLKYADCKEHPILPALMMSLGYDCSHLSVLKAVSPYIDIYLKKYKMIKVNGFLDILGEYREEELDYILIEAIFQNEESVFTKLINKIESLNSKLEESLFELVIGFDRLNILSHLKRNLNMEMEEFATFKAIQKTLPQKHLWISNLEQIGGDNWHVFEKTDTHAHRLLKSDIWILKSLTFPIDIKLDIESKSNRNEIIPLLLNRKEYTVDIESFRQLECFSDLTEIWLQCFLTSSVVSGSIAEFDEIYQGKLQASTTIKVTCIQASSSDDPKMIIDESGAIHAFVKIVTENGTTYVQQDRSLHQQFIETELKDEIEQNVIPYFNDFIKEEFGLNINVRIDWNTLEQIKHSGNIVLILKSINGSLFGNKLGGLEDVLLECRDMKSDIESMFNFETVQIALTSIQDLSEIIVVFDDNISLQYENIEGISNGRRTEWHFTISESKVFYDRSQLSLWRYLTLYHAFCSSVCGNIHLIANIPTEYNTKLRNKGLLTFEVDIQSFGINKTSMLQHLLCEDVARELTAIAYDCQSVLRLEKISNKVVLKASATLQKTGISFQESTATIHISCKKMSKDVWSVERSNCQATLEEAEEQQLVSNWPNTIFEESRDRARKVEAEVLENFGFKINLQIDEKHLLYTSLRSCRREYEHPFTLIEKSTRVALDLFERAYKEIFEEVINSVSVQVDQISSTKSGLWKLEMPDPKRKMNVEDIIVIEIDAKNPELLTASETPIHRNYHCYRKTRFFEYKCYVHSSTKYSFTRHLERKLLTENNQTGFLPDFMTRASCVFRIVDTEYIGEILRKVRLKNNISIDITKSLECNYFEKIRRQLLPATSANIPSAEIVLLMHATEKELKKFFPIIEIFIDWKSFMQKNTHINVKRFRNCTQSLIDSLWEIFGGHLECVRTIKFKSCLWELFSGVNKWHICMQDSPENRSRDIDDEKRTNPKIIILESREIKFCFGKDIKVKPFAMLLYQASVCLAEVNIERILECKPRDKSLQKKQSKHDNTAYSNSILCQEFPYILEQYGDICYVMLCLKTHINGFISLVQQAIENVEFSASEQTTISITEKNMVFEVSKDYISKRDLTKNIMQALQINEGIATYPDFQIELPIYFISQHKYVKLILNAVNLFGDNTEEFINSICEPTDFMIQLKYNRNKDVRVTPSQIENIGNGKMGIIIPFSTHEITNSNFMCLTLSYKDSEIESCQISTVSKILNEQSAVTYGGSVTLRKDESVYILLRHDNINTCNQVANQSPSKLHVRTVKTIAGVEFEAFFKRINFASPISHAPFTLSKVHVDLPKTFNIFKLTVLDAKRQFRLRASCVCCHRHLAVISKFGTVTSNQSFTVN